jgi:SAM-dependent methyltransferase
MVSQAAPWFGRDPKTPQHYRGLRMMSDTHLHDQLQELIGKIIPPTAVSGRKPMLLDLGCGEGALSQRLFDLGYDVLAVDCDSTQFKALGPTFLCADLNDPQSCERFVAEHSGKFDLILAVEVIEHLHSPWNLIATCRRLCREDTHLILTTPNVGSWWGRLWFFLTGELWSFGQESLDDPGHISPLPAAIMKRLLKENGFECLSVTPGGCLPVVWAYNWKRLLLSLALWPMRCLMRGEKDGWVLCYHAKPT